MAWQPEIIDASTESAGFGESGELSWKPDWAGARMALTEWWHGRGLALHVTSPAETMWGDLPRPRPAEATDLRLNTEVRLAHELFRMASTYHGGVAFPMLNTDIGGPGSLGLFLGAEGRIDDGTVWYEPCIHDPERYEHIRLDRNGDWWKLHVTLIEEARKLADGRFLVPMPDLIENLDTLAQLRGSQSTLFDLVERPDWVKKTIDQINGAYLECFEGLFELLADRWGGNSFFAFQLWGPGRTAKVQCDFCCMISPAMFRKFVQPALAAQCRYLDYAMFHLDGTQALPQLPNLLEMEEIKAIEWTPQAGLPRGGSVEWYGLYREIRSAGKSVQAVEVAPEEVEPLIDAVGPEGLFILTETETEAAARCLLRRVGWAGA